MWDFDNPLPVCLDHVICDGQPPNPNGAKMVNDYDEDLEYRNDHIVM